MRMRKGESRPREGQLQPAASRSHHEVTPLQGYVLPGFRLPGWEVLVQVQVVQIDWASISSSPFYWQFQLNGFRFDIY